MMNADKQVLYSGVPQEEWNDKSKYPKILSNGPKILKPKVKSSRNTGLISFLILTLVAILVSLGVVIGLHYLKYTEENGIEFINYNENETATNNPLDNVENSLGPQLPKDSEVDKNKKEKENQDHDKHSQDDPKKKDQKKNMNSTNLEDKIQKENPISKDDPKDQIYVPKGTTKGPLKPKTTTEDDWLDIIKTDDRLFPYDNIFDKMTSEEDESDQDKLNQSDNDNNQKDSHENDNNNQMDENNNDTDQKDKNEKDNKNKDKDEKDDKKKDKDEKDNKQKDTDDNDNDNKEEYITASLINGTKNINENDHESLSKVISSFASKYFNSSSLNKEEVMEWIEKLTARPSLEVIIIASGIIFVGLSLLIIAITCLLTRTRRIRIRREKLSKAVKDLEGGEKVILLTDEPSEDEFVKT